MRALLKYDNRKIARDCTPTGCGPELTGAAELTIAFADDTRGGIMRLTVPDLLTTSRSLERREASISFGIVKLIIGFVFHLTRPRNAYALDCISLFSFFK